MDTANECSANWEKSTNYKIEGETLYKNGEPYVKIKSLNEETGEFEAVIISDNQYLNGQQIVGMFISRATKYTGPLN